MRPWTLPNAIGFTRLALIPVFLIVELSSGDGTGALGATLFAVIGWGDYADGIAARVTGQYSRLGALMDPVTDRLLVVSGVVVCWHFQLLPRWAIAVLALRELAMLALGRYGLKRGVELRINWPGRSGGRAGDGRRSFSRWLACGRSARCCCTLASCSRWWRRGCMCAMGEEGCERLLRE